MSNVPWQWPNSIITRIVDGDSFTARVTRDIGFHGWTTFDVRLRLNRVNALPIKTLEGIAAKEFFASLVNPNIAIVMIETTKPYKYGDEWMAEVTLSDGRNVSDELVKNAMAVYWDGTGPRPD
jgi:endonuclease YncB( thermonuclease family)